jgi:hypothetical protein
MYELKLGTPSGDILIGLKPEAAEAVKQAVFAALLAQARAEAQTASAGEEAGKTAPKPSRPRSAAQTAYGGSNVNPDSPMQKAIRAALDVSLPSPSEPLTVAQVTALLGEFKEASVQVALGSFYREGKMSRQRVGRAWGYQWADRPPSVVAAFPQVKLDNNGFRVTLAAGEGIVKGAVEE